MSILLSLKPPPRRAQPQLRANEQRLRLRRAELEFCAPVAKSSSIMTRTKAQTDERREKQVRDAEELLFAGPQKLGVAKGLFLGRFVADWVMPYPKLGPEESDKVERSLTELRHFLDEYLDPAAIDRQADIPREVIDGLARLGVLGMTAPVEVGGRGFSQMAYGRVLEEIGGRCASTSIFVNAHHSIG